MKQGTIKAVDFDMWMDLSDVKELEGLNEKCDRRYIEDYIYEHVKMRDVVVAKAEIIRDGEYRAPNLMGKMGEMMPPSVCSGLPEFINVEILHKTGKYQETIWVWIPFRWNGRFFGCCGGGNRTANISMQAPGTRSVNLPTVLKNGFACACSDGANREDEFFGWGVDWEKKEMSQELFQNWIRYSTHNMTVIGKAVTEALTGEAPEYSYIMGGSGGGRQVLSEAQYYPADYDGYWSDAPCVSYNRMLLALSWPYVVMNTYKDTLSFSKFEAFQELAFEKAGGKEAFYNRQEAVECDPYEIVGKETEDGPITELDAKVMKLIWEGPQTEDGDFLWYGMRPGVDGWSGVFAYSAVRKTEQGWIPVHFPLNDEFIKNWIMKDPDYDTSKIDIKEYTRLHIKCQELFSDMDTDSPDLRELRDLGGKMILCHGVDDDAIYVDGTVSYYDRIVNLFESREAAKEVARLLIVPGDGHCVYSKYGAGPSIATAVEALMHWVEDGKAPESIHGQRFDLKNMCGAEEKDTPIL